MKCSRCAVLAMKGLRPIVVWSGKGRDGMFLDHHHDLPWDVLARCRSCDALPDAIHCPLHRRQSHEQTFPYPLGTYDRASDPFESEAAQREASA